MDRRRQLNANKEEKFLSRCGEEEEAIAKANVLANIDDVISNANAIPTSTTTSWNKNVDRPYWLGRYNHSVIIFN